MLTWQQVTHNTYLTGNTRHTIPRESKELSIPSLQTGWEVQRGLHCSGKLLRIPPAQTRPACLWGRAGWGQHITPASRTLSQIQLTLIIILGHRATAHCLLRSYWYVFQVKGNDDIWNISISLYYTSQPLASLTRTESFNQKYDAKWLVENELLPRWRVCDTF